MRERAVEGLTLKGSSLIYTLRLHTVAPTLAYSSVTHSPLQRHKRNFDSPFRDRTNCKALVFASI